MTGGSASIEIETPPVPVYWSITITELEQLLHYASSNPLLQMTIQQMMVNKNAGWEVYTISQQMISQVMQLYTIITHQSHVQVNPAVPGTQTQTTLEPVLTSSVQVEPVITGSETLVPVTVEPVAPGLEPVTSSPNSISTELPPFASTEAPPATTPNHFTTGATWPSEEPVNTSEVPEQTCIFSNKQVERMKGNKHIFYKIFFVNFIKNLSDKRTNYF